MGEDDEHSRNAAGRIYSFLAFCWTTAVDTSVLDLVAGYLELPSKAYTPQLLTAMAAFLELPGQAKREVEALIAPPIPKVTLLDELPRAENAMMALASGVQMPASAFKNYYDAGTLKSLQLTSHILNSASTVKRSVPADNLDEVKKLADELVASLGEDDMIDDELRRLLFEHADAIRRSVDLFKVAGIDAVLEEFDGLAGLLMRRSNLIADIPKESKTRRAMWALLSALNVIAGIGNASVAIDGGVTSLLQITGGK